MLARPTRRATYHRALGSERNSDTQSERKLRRSEGSSMLINDPLGEGSNASSINQGEQSIGCRGIREDQEGRCPPKGKE